MITKKTYIQTFYYVLFVILTFISQRQIVKYIILYHADMLIDDSQRTLFIILYGSYCAVLGIIIFLIIVNLVSIISLIIIKRKGNIQLFRVLLILTILIDIITSIYIIYSYQ